MQKFWVMPYLSSIQFHKTVNETPESFTPDHVALLDNIICTRRQLRFEIFRNNRTKIGMNCLSNKFYHISKQISLDSLNLGFVHFKKLMKIQFQGLSVAYIICRSGQAIAYFYIAYKNYHKLEVIAAVIVI